MKEKTEEAGAWTLGLLLAGGILIFVVIASVQSLREAATGSSETEPTPAGQSAGLSEEVPLAGPASAMSARVDLSLLPPPHLRLAEPKKGILQTGEPHRPVPKRDVDLMEASFSEVHKQAAMLRQDAAADRKSAHGPRALVLSEKEIVELEKRGDLIQ